MLANWTGKTSLEISTLFAASAVSPFASHVIFSINNNKKFPISSSLLKGRFLNKMEFIDQ